MKRERREGNYSIQGSAQPDVELDGGDRGGISRPGQCCGLHACLSGCFSCYWKKIPLAGRTSWWDCTWIGVLFVVFLYRWCQSYAYWVMYGNNEDYIDYLFNDMLRTGSIKFGQWHLILTVVLTVYVTALVCVTSCLCGYRRENNTTHPLAMHWSHKILLVLILLVTVGSTYGQTFYYPPVWALAVHSLEFYGPFLQMGFVVFLTCLAYPIAATTLGRSATWRKVLFSPYALTLCAVYLSPLWLTQSPCITAGELRASSPKLVAHRGAAANAPENTLAAFHLATTLERVIILEMDVSISLDGVPFIMHDDTFIRTTNIQDVFPERSRQHVTLFNITEIKMLDAGSWFLRDNPFGTAHALTSNQKQLYSEQRVPTLAEVLGLVKVSNVSLIFDTKSTGNRFSANASRLIDDVIQESGVPSRQILSFHSKAQDSDYTHVRHSNGLGDNMETLLGENVSFVNARVDNLNWDKITKFREHGIGYIAYLVDSAWLLSLCTSGGVYAITTNRAVDFNDIVVPLWRLSPGQYTATWVTIDCLSLLICTSIVILVSRRNMKQVYLA